MNNFPGWQKKKSKYGNKKTIVDGIKFASKKEAARYQELKLLEKQKLISDLELQKVYELKVNGEKICSYVADFVYLKKMEGYWEPVFEDCKGFKTPEYKLKKKLMKAIYGIEILET